MAPIQWMNQHQHAIGPFDDSKVETSPLLRRLALLWVIGTLILLPVDLIHLPLNMSLVDIWILMALPLLWLSFLRGKQVVSLSYAIPVLLILIGSFVSIFAAPAPRNSLIVILKEVYVFVWFITLTAVLSTLNARSLRRILLVWTAMVLLHGFLILAQFISPDFWRFIAGISGRSLLYEAYRPSGLFANANSAAFFQLLGFVPLVLVSHSPRVAMILCVLLLPTMLVTGSMGATLAFIAGLMVVVFAVCLSKYMVLAIKFFVQLTVILLFVGGLFSFIVSYNARYQEHFQRIFLGRAERSSEGRFNLWQRGVDVYLDQGVFIWGVGPENFREVDRSGKDNQLHSDFLAFLVERGLLGALGLVLFAALAASRAAYMVLLHFKHPGRTRFAVVVFPAAIVAVMVESLTHQTFHFRALWLVLALQEAMLFQMMTLDRELAPTTHALPQSPHHRGYVVQQIVPGG